MQYGTFLETARSRLNMVDRAHALRALRATLKTLGERLRPDQAETLAKNLPMEIDRFLKEADSGQQFSYREFLDRVSSIENCDKSESALHAQHIVGLLDEVVPTGKLRSIRETLPADFYRLFDRVSEPAPD